jgi:hypothetical protein
MRYDRANNVEVDMSLPDATAGDSLPRQSGNPRSVFRARNFNIRYFDR